MIKIIVANIPNSWFGTNSEKYSVKKPIQSTRVVPMIAFPVESIELDTASPTSLVFFNSCLNLAKKWMVSSTAIPRAIENVIAVDGLNFIQEKLKLC